MSYWGNHGEEVEVDVDVKKDIDIDFEMDAKIDIYKEFDAYVDICVDVDIDGNSATFAIDIEAFGKNSATELDLAVLVTDESSSIIAVGYAAVD